MADVKLSEILTSNPAAAPTGVEPIESVQSATSVAFTFAQLSNNPLNAQTGTTYTLAITDQGKAVTMNNAAANTLTIPLNATIAFDIGTLLVVRQIGAGLTTLAATGGVTINKVAGLSLTMSEAQEQFILHKTATDTWHVFAGGSGGGGGSPSAARISNDSSQSAGTDTTVVFTSEEYDDNGFSDLGVNNDRFTIPTGVTRINVSGAMEGSSHTATGNQQLVIQLFDSGDSFLTNLTAQEITVPDTSPRITCSALGVVVAPTNYLVLRTFGSDGTWNIVKASLTIQDVTP